jgi:hypothetical protein
VRILATALLVSVAVHGTAVGYAWWIEETQEKLPQVVIELEGDDEEPELQPIDNLAAVVPFVEVPEEIRPMELVLDAVVPTRSRSPEATAAAAAAAPSRIATGTTTGSETARAGPATDGPAAAHDGVMKMRRPSLKKQISGSFLETFLASSKPVPRADDTPERVDDDLRAAREAARKGDPGARERVVALNEQKAGQDLKPVGGGSYQADRTTFKVKVAPDGSVDIRDKRNLQREGLGARFDVTDALMRQKGIDPYAAEKMKLLDKTREQRVNIGNRYRKEQLSRSAELAQNNIDRLWATVTSLAGRKQGLFDLWDECEDVSTGGGTGNDRVAGGVAARSLIEGTIRSRLTGANAYTAQEIAALNAKRRSKALFAPYQTEPVRVVVPPAESTGP